MQGRIVSLRVGRIRELARPDWDHAPERTWRTAYDKPEQPGAVRVGFLGMEGDEHGSPDVHGGPEQVVLAYAAAHYADWRQVPGLESMGPGGFAENVTLEGLDESLVCVGDEYAIGEVRLQVSQPRGPCSSISRFWNQPELLKQVAANGRTGWYHRVRSEGAIERGMTVSLVSRPHAQWTIARLNDLASGRVVDAAEFRALAACPELSPEWREKFARKGGAA
ncbi:MAG: MOSC domain-containing protein [Candidatus Eisenbacteria bacterium]|nr:MOSC domain-containing protein [Candidatus Eisenbacteria bacterium]